MLDFKRRVRRWLGMEEVTNQILAAISAAKWSSPPAPDHYPEPPPYTHTRPQTVTVGEYTTTVIPTPSSSCDPHLGRN